MNEALVKDLREAARTRSQELDDLLLTSAADELERLSAPAAESSRIAWALTLVLPMAKAYAAEHPVGGNQGKCDFADAALEATPATEFICPQCGIRTDPPNGDPGF